MALTKDFRETIRLNADDAHSCCGFSVAVRTNLLHWHLPHPPEQYRFADHRQQHTTQLPLKTLRESQPLHFAMNKAHFHIPTRMLTYMLSLAVFDVREYIDRAGRSPFTKWLRALNVQAAAKVATGLELIADGNLSNVRPIGSGVLEYKIDLGPGYRIY